MSATDYYGVLGVAEDASPDEIRRAYRRLARKYHPDVNAGAAGAEDRFKAVSEAHSVLSDPARRESYDRSRKGGWAPADGAAGFGFGGDVNDLGDLFARVFAGARGFSARQGAGGAQGFPGSHGRPGGRRRPSAEPPEMTAEIGFLESLRGLTLPIHLRDAAGNQETIQVRVPAGVRDGDRLRVPPRGQGAAREGLRVRIKVARHPVFRRQGRHVALTVPVTVCEAALGASIEVPTPDGTARLRVPAGTASGQRLRLAGKGAPDRHGGRGDLLVEVQVLTPTAGDAQSRELLERLQERQPAAPREELLRRART